MFWTCFWMNHQASLYVYSRVQRPVLYVCIYQLIYVTSFRYKHEIGNIVTIYSTICLEFDKKVGAVLSGKDGKIIHKATRCG